MQSPRQSFNLCLNCFSSLNGSTRCPTCGFELYRTNQGDQALPLGTLIGNRYLLGHVVGQGGFGIIYHSYDTEKKIEVAVKEFFISGATVRRGQQVTFNSEDKRASFKKGLEAFLNESSTLNHFRDIPEIVTIFDTVRTNDTAYIIMEYLRGPLLSDYVPARGGRLSYGEAERLLGQVETGLIAIHKAGFIHRDIAPNNIFITENARRAVITDFGSTISSNGKNPDGFAESKIFKHGYSPIELYTNVRKLGDWCDVYSLAATYYYVLTGRVPDDATQRLSDDTLTPIQELLPQIPAQCAAAIMKGLTVDPRQRYHSVEEFRKARGVVAEPAVSTPEPVAAPPMISIHHDKTGPTPPVAEPQPVRQPSRPIRRRTEKEADAKVAATVRSRPKRQRLAKQTSSRNVQNANGVSTGKKPTRAKPKTGARILTGLLVVALVALIVFGIFQALNRNGATTESSTAHRPGSSNRRTDRSGAPNFPPKPHPIFETLPGEKKPMLHFISIPDDSPLHETGAKGFWIDDGEITFAMYKRCRDLGENICQINSSGQNDESPVVFVSKSQAAEFCDWAGGRLPTIQEWRLAAQSDPELEYMNGGVSEWVNVSVDDYSKNDTGALKSSTYAKSGNTIVAGPNVLSKDSDWYLTNEVGAAAVNIGFRCVYTFDEGE